MADALMTSTVGTSSVYPTWDFHVIADEVPLITGEEEELQTAMISAFLQTGNVPQFPDLGVNWTGYLLGTSPFGSLDMEIRQALVLSESSDFEPSYDIVNDRLYTTIKRRT